MSIIIIAFPGAPKICNEAIRAENELNELLQQKVLGKTEINDNYTNCLSIITCRNCERVGE